MQHSEATGDVGSGRDGPGDTGLRGLQASMPSMSRADHSDMQAAPPPEGSEVFEVGFWSDNQPQVNSEQYRESGPGLDGLHRGLEQRFRQRFLETHSINNQSASIPGSFNVSSDPLEMDWGFNPALLYDLPWILRLKYHMLFEAQTSHVLDPSLIPNSLDFPSTDVVEPQRDATSIADAFPNHGLGLDNRWHNPGEVYSELLPHLRPNIPKCLDQTSTRDLSFRPALEQTEFSHQKDLELPGVPQKCKVSFPFASLDTHDQPAGARVIVSSSYGFRPKDENNQAESPMGNPDNIGPLRDPSLNSSRPMTILPCGDVASWNSTLPQSPSAPPSHGVQISDGSSETANGLAIRAEIIANDGRQATSYTNTEHPVKKSGLGDIGRKNRRRRQMAGQRRGTDKKASRGKFFGCPFARSGVDLFAPCRTVRRKDLRGIREHLRRDCEFHHWISNRGEIERPHATSWDMIFVVCLPFWSPQWPFPTPYHGEPFPQVSHELLQSMTMIQQRRLQSGREFQSELKNILDRTEPSDFPSPHRGTLHDLSSNGSLVQSHTSMSSTAPTLSPSPVDSFERSGYQSITTVTTPSSYSLEAETNTDPSLSSLYSTHQHPLSQEALPFKTIVAQAWDLVRNVCGMMEANPAADKSDINDIANINIQAGLAC